MEPVIQEVQAVISRKAVLMSRQDHWKTSHPGRMSVVGRASANRGLQGSGFRGGFAEPELSEEHPLLLPGSSFATSAPILSTSGV